MNVAQFSLIQDGIYAFGKAHKHYTPSLRIFRNIDLKQFHIIRLTDDRWYSLVLSRKIVYRFLIPRLSAPGDRWCDVPGFVPADNVSSSSTLPMFRDASHYLLYHFCSLPHVQGSTRTFVFEGGCRTLI